MNRRSFLSTLGMAGLAAGGCKYWPDDGIWNACLRDVLSSHLAQHELVQAAWEGIDPNYFWDVHVHLLGVGDGASGIWVNPGQSSLTLPVRYFFQKIYLNASCAEGVAKVISEVRHYNPLLFDFLLKRHVRVGGSRFHDTVFQSRHFFDSTTQAASGTTSHHYS